MSETNPTHLQPDFVSMAKSIFSLSEINKELLEALEALTARMDDFLNTL